MKINTYQQREQSNVVPFFFDAILALADGSVFYGKSIGAVGQTVGEVVFNTAMTGYQEMLTDPSYKQQILTLTYPHIGNVGINQYDNESAQIQVAGLVIRDAALRASNWRSEQSLSSYLKAQNIVAIADIDTRRLTRLLREQGIQNGCIATGHDTVAALTAARNFTGLNGLDLAQVVTTKVAYTWHSGSWNLASNQPVEAEAKQLPYHVVAYDFGIKHTILRLLVDHGCRVSVVPAKTPADEVLSLQPDGIFFSNGPGDPQPCDYAIDALCTFLAADIPFLGICLGHQLLGLAVGAQTIKTKFGHHGANHPVQDLRTGDVLITTQNHSFAIDEATLPDNVIATHRSLFDNSLQGIALTDKRAFSFQGHPEASPGTHDMQALFAQFIMMMQKPS